ncbi:MAG: type IV secretory system conjugative DNA transfer family protein [Bacilli bacterium]|nr:type IV secretory system conjugative DNA transfer family protein [Bacilli bacterium]
MNTLYVIIAILIVIFLIGFIYIEPILMKHKVKNDNEYGSARFSTDAEIKQNFNKENVNHIKEAGFPVSFSKNLKYIYFDRETPHYVYLGSTGSGKSVTAVIPTCTFISKAKKKRSVFITDPKGEIYQTTSQMFKNRGYKIITIDFRNPELSNKINILEPIIEEYEEYMKYEKKSIEMQNKISLLTNQNSELKAKLKSIKLSAINISRINNKIADNQNIINELNNEKMNYTNNSMSHYAETNRLISSLATMVMQEKVEQKDPFWNESAKNLLEGLIGFFLEEYKEGNITREKITMTSIRKFQNSSMEENNNKKFKDYINKKEYGSKSKDALVSILSASDNTYKSITAVFGQKMNIFDDINVANVTSISDFKFNELGKEPVALYVIVPDEDKTYFTLVTIIVGLLYRDLVKLANSTEKKKLPYEIDFILDEFANCPPLADIEAIVSVARSRGMHFHFFIQSFSQLDNVYGKEVAQIILDNCGLVYLKTNTQETAEAISKRLGKKTIESNSVRQSMSLLNYNGDRSTNLIGRDLMTPEEVKQLHYKTIIFPIIGFPIFRDTILYNKFSCYESGKVEREACPLKNLSYTYFTVENINHEVPNKKRGATKDEKEYYAQLELADKENLRPVELIIEKIFKLDYDIKYNVEANHRVHMSVKINRELKQREKTLLSTKIKTEFYHTEIKEEEEKTIINIYNENPNLSLGLRG